MSSGFSLLFGGVFYLSLPLGSQMCRLIALKDLNAINCRNVLHKRGEPYFLCLDSNGYHPTCFNWKFPRHLFFLP